MTDEQQIVLDVIAHLFGERGRWPPYRYVDKLLDLEHGVDLAAELAVFPAGLIWPEPRGGYSFVRYEGEIGLTAAGLAKSPLGRKSMQYYVKAVRHLAMREYAFAPESWDQLEELEIDSDELQSALGLDDITLSQLYWIFRLDPHAIAGSSGSPAGPWTITVSREARRYREVRTVDDYLERRERPHPADAARQRTGLSPQVEQSESLPVPASEEPAKVFVVHGRNAAARRAMFEFLRSIGLEPLEWPELVDATGTGAPYIGDILSRGFAIAQAVVILLTPDDEGQLREQLRGETELPWEIELTPQARLNVIFEAGMAFASHPQQTVLVELGQLRPFSDIAGRHVVRLDNSTQSRQEFAQRLRRAGCPVNLSGTDWHATGDFEGSVIGTELGKDEVEEVSAVEDADSDNPPVRQFKRYASASLLRVSFELFIDTFLWRRRELSGSSTIPQQVREEYEEQHRALVKDFSRVRDDYIEFVESDPSYDLRLGEEFSQPIDYPLTQWWQPLTFTDALAHWSNADDNHLEPFLTRQKVVLRAFAERERSQGAGANRSR